MSSLHVSALVGLPVRCDSSVLGHVHDVIIDHSTRCAAALLLDVDRSASARIVPLDAVLDLAADGVTLLNEDDVTPASKLPRVQQLLMSHRPLSELRVVDDRGRLLGAVCDVCVDGDTGDVLSYQLCRDQTALLDVVVVPSGLLTWQGEAGALGYDAARLVDDLLRREMPIGRDERGSKRA